MSDPKFLFVIYSCKQNFKKADLLYSILKHKLNHCKILIAYGDPTISGLFFIQSDKYLVLNCGDFYEHLSTKTLTLFHSFSNGFSGYKGLFKCDDDILPNISNLNSHINYLLENDIPYSGNCVENIEYITVSHYNKPIPQYFMTPYLIPSCSYCPGPIYYLDRKAINKFNGEICVHLNFFEDVMVGVHLNKCGIYPDKISLYSDDFSDKSSISIHNFNNKIRFIYIQLHGRLGNWLFQVFSAYGIARKSGRVLIIFGDDPIIPPIFSSILNEGQVFYVHRDELNMNDHITYDESNENDPTKNCFQCYDRIVQDIAPETDLFLFGYFQNSKYFMEYKHDVYRILQNQDILTRLLTIYPSLSNSYFIHVRRGDYVGHPLYSFDYDFYYRSAIFYILDKDPSANFFIVSDDIDYCKTYEVFSLIPTIFVEGLSPIYSIFLMSLCYKGGICANSSFSWWGSYLNMNEDKTVIMPKTWMNISKPIDIYYENVIVI
jgi:hypothetical protein